MIRGIEVLFGFLCFIATAGIVLALPIYVIVQFVQMRRRLTDLEREFRLFRERGVQPAALVERVVEDVEVLEVVPIEAVPEVTPAPVLQPESPRSTRTKRTPASGEVNWSKLEVWLGVRGLGWAAVVLLLITGAFFLKIVFERGLIGELGRVTIGVLLATFLCSAGLWCHRRGQVIFSQMLTSAGIALLYLSMYATFGFYQLLPQDHAAPFLIALVGLAFALAAMYYAPAIAIMAVVGGLLTPLLLHSDTDRYVGFFSYLAILNLGVVGLSFFRRWWVVSSLALVGTHLLFWAWFNQRYHPQKLDACLTFHGALLAMYLAQLVIVNIVQRQSVNAEELIRQLVLAILASSAGYVLLEPEYPRWMGTFAVGFAIVYALMGAIVNRFQADDEPLLFTTLALAMAFVAAVFPLQLEAAWIAVGWAVQGLALWWFGLRVQARLLHGLGAVFLLLALGRLFFIDVAGKQTHDDLFVPIFNSFGLPATIIAISPIIASLMQRRTSPDLNSSDFIIMRTLGLAGVLTLWIVLSIETYDFFIVRGDLTAPGVRANLTQRERELPEQMLYQRYESYREQLRLLAQMALSVLWAVFALVQLAVGLRLQHRPLRWLALGLFAITLGKVMIVDTERLDGLYRVGAFFVLSLMMAAGAWVYQRLRHALTAGQENT